MDNDQIKELINRKWQEVRENKDYFTLLEVSDTASIPTVKKAYFSLVKQIHPDVVKRLNDDEMLQRSKDVFQALTKAYQVLSNPSERARYSSGMGRQTGQHRAMDKKEEAQLLFRKGKFMFDRRTYAEARKKLEEVISLDPKMSKAYLYLALSWFHDPNITDDVRLPRTKKYLDKAMELNKEDPQLYYALALYYKAMGEYTMEYQALEDALTLDPDYLEAKRELRLLSMRWKKGKTDSLSSQWADFVTTIKNLFNKKK